MDKTIKNVIDFHEAQLNKSETQYVEFGFYLTDGYATEIQSTIDLETNEGVFVTLACIIPLLDSICEALGVDPLEFLGAVFENVEN